jgi:hypothetical protein
MTVRNGYASLERRIERVDHPWFFIETTFDKRRQDC